MAVQERNRAIIDQWIVPSPAGLGLQDARLAEYGVSVWSLVAYSRVVDGDVARVAADYDLPQEAVAAAFAYYEAHRSLIDAQIALNEAAFAGQGVLTDFYFDNDVSGKVAPLLEARGHTVVTTPALRRTRAKDPEQLLVAAQQNRVLVTHNANHYVVLHDAWRIWAQEWQVTPVHAGILIVPHMQPPMIAHRIDVFLSQALPLPNELYLWKPQGGWTRYRQVRGVKSPSAR